MQLRRSLWTVKGRTSAGGPRLPILRSWEKFPSSLFHENEAFVTDEFERQRHNQNYR